MPSAKPAKKLFLVDAMGFIFRAFFAPMERLRSPSGMPTKVPYLFVQMLKRLMRDYQPDYLAVAFDLPEPTFRDKLFAEYKAKRPPMPDAAILTDLHLEKSDVEDRCAEVREEFDRASLMLSES